MSQNMNLLEGENGEGVTPIRKTPVLEIDKYLAGITPYIQAQGYIMDQEYQRNQIKALVDKMAYPDSFNGLLFNELLSKFPQKQMISLNNFFIEYFKLYETLKQNRTQLANMNNNLATQAENLKNQIRESRDGTEDNKFIFKIEAFKENNLNCPIRKIGFNYKGEFLEQFLEFEEGQTECNIEFRSESDVISGNFQLFVQMIDNETSQIDTLVPCNYNKSEEKKYRIGEYELRICVTWIKSIFEFCNTKLAQIENLIENQREQIVTLNSNIIQLEAIFKQTSLNSPSIYDQEAKKNADQGTTLNQLIGVGDKVENLVLGITGQEKIIWGDVAYWLNTAVIGFLVVQFLRRFDMTQLALSFGVYSVLYDITPLKYGYYILYGTIGNLVIEVIWTLYYMSNWYVTILHEQLYGTFLRKAVLTVGWIMIITLVALIFAFWKYLLEKQFREANKNTITFELKQESAPPTGVRGQKPKSVAKRLNLAYTDSGKFTIRRFDEENEP